MPLPLCPVLEGSFGHGCSYLKRFLHFRTERYDFFFLVMFTDTLAFANPLLSFYSTLAGYSIGFRRPENAHSVLGGNPSVPPNL